MSIGATHSQTHTHKHSHSRWKVCDTRNKIQFQKLEKTVSHAFQQQQLRWRNSHVLRMNALFRIQAQSKMYLTRAFFYQTESLILFTFIFVLFLFNQRNSKWTDIYFYLYFSNIFFLISKINLLNIFISMQFPIRWEANQKKTIWIDWCLFWPTPWSMLIKN